MREYLILLTYLAYIIEHMNNYPQDSKTESIL